MNHPTGDPQFHAVYSHCQGPSCIEAKTRCSRARFSGRVYLLSNANILNLLFFFSFFFFLFHSQEALSVFKEAIQKMPRQFAPQSLYNMMGKCCFCFRITSIKSCCKGLMGDGYFWKQLEGIGAVHHTFFPLLFPAFLGGFEPFKINRKNPLDKSAIIQLSLSITNYQMTYSESSKCVKSFSFIYFFYVRSQSL